MTDSVSTQNIQVILLDIEGTTTPIAFVYDVLFPFARAHLREYLRDSTNAGALREPLRRIGQASNAWGEEPPQDPERIAQVVEWLMDRDAKSPGLKLLQGQIWEKGYLSGALKGDVFEDVPGALRRWRRAGVTVAIYSSGSELAQRLLFGTTPRGDLTPLIARFFDTAAGAKTAPESYRRIAAEFACPADRILFVSDVTSELDAADTAGCRVLLCVRPGNRPQPPHTFAIIESFEAIP